MNAGLVALSEGSDGGERDLMSKDKQCHEGDSESSQRKDLGRKQVPRKEFVSLSSFENVNSN